MIPPDLAGALGRSARRFAPDDLARTLPMRRPVVTAQDGPLGLAWSSVNGRGTGTQRTLVAFAGRILGLEPLAAELGTGGSSIAETLALGFDRLGEDLLPRLRGAFSLVLWDRLRHRGLLVRDQLGATPLFMHTGSGELLFSTEIRTLLALLPTRPGPDETAIVHRLARSQGPSERTLYQGVERVPPGHLVRLEGERWKLVRWWTPRYRAVVERPYPQLIAELKVEMGSAVARQVHGDTSLGVMLSGGFDSAAAAAAAAERPQSYSAVFPENPTADESEGIALTRRALGLSGVQASVIGGSALGAAVEFLDEWLVPPASPNWFIWAPLMHRAANDGITALLDGEGGDELFGASPALLADLLRAGRLLEMVHLARRIPGMGGAPRPRWVARAVRHYGVRPALPAQLHALLRRARRLRSSAPSLLRPNAERLRRASERTWTWKKLDGPRWWASLAGSLTTGSDALGAAEHLRREGALAGVELRHPWRDLDLVEFMLGVPPALSFHPDLDRPLAREAMGRALPHHAQPRPDKAYFNSLLVDALRGVDRHAVNALLLGSGAEVMRYVTPSAVRDVLGESGTAPGRAAEVWELALMEVWLRREGGVATPLMPAQAPAAVFEEI